MAERENDLQKAADELSDAMRILASEAIRQVWNPDMLLRDGVIPEHLKQIDAAYQAVRVKVGAFMALRTRDEVYLGVDSHLQSSLDSSQDTRQRENPKVLDYQE